MALSGLEIYKLLPRTNCKKCGFPTCLAFAMKLAAKQAELSACPTVSDEAKAALEAAAAPPIRLITLAAGHKKIEAGNETVLFRHEKTFFHQPGLFARIRDTQSLDEIKQAAATVAGYTVERVGIALGLDGVAVENASGDAGAFAAAMAAVRSAGDLPLILMSDSPAAIKAGLEKAAGTTPLVCAATEANWQEMAAAAVAGKAALAVRGTGDLNALAALVEKVKGAGVEDIVLDPGVRGLAATLVAQTQLRRLALKQNLRLLGFPIIAFPGDSASAGEQAIAAGQAIAKYAGFIVLDHYAPADVYPLLTLRQNIYTDPQKPIQVSPGLYEINNPKPEAPLLVTTNFSLTYFSVAGEVEGGGFPAWLLICDAEGMSVLTAWAAGKFDAERIAKAVKSSGIEGKLNHKKVVLPGAVATLSGELEEELPGWEIRVGPREAIDLPAYLKNVWK
ncbi:MAG TPA: acetyl-CoA decarbonylase/synthase complex subunit gamma [Anaerolineae bacterium]|nr:acetyl-CoA decarbonylase/synthase complex subunit gamma [Anaerolineae bacterium]HOR00326.1 acetyl-CoA decarbonylase/synthase complex subunit gamma [Anaerolineae bacterium]HPL29856.1 acetyl-CoA decarbonylase/synthase complex subunit gamma [Anaerolineae bacterium]